MKILIVSRNNRLSRGNCEGEGLHNSVQKLEGGVLTYLLGCTVQDDPYERVTLPTDNSFGIYINYTI